LAADTFVTALLLITAVISAGILINAVYPVVWNMAGTFSSASHETDTRMRTDFKIVSTYALHQDTPPAPPPVTVNIWMKNIGTNRIGEGDITRSDVFIGKVGDFFRAKGVPGIRTTPLSSPPFPSLNEGEWSYNLFDDNDNFFWDPGETLEIAAYTSRLTGSAQGAQVHFEFTLPTGVLRSTEFTLS
jgi:flagellar protein FlaG